MFRYYAGLIVCCLAASACTTSTTDRYVIHYEDGIDDYIASLSISGPSSCDESTVVVQGITQRSDQLVLIVNLTTASSASVILSQREGFVLHAPLPPSPARGDETQYKVSTFTSDGVMTNLAYITVDESRCDTN